MTFLYKPLKNKFALVNFLCQLNATIQLGQIRTKIGQHIVVYKKEKKKGDKAANLPAVTGGFFLEGTIPVIPVSLTFYSHLPNVC